LNQHQINKEDVEKLRTHGFDDRAVHDAAQVISYFNYITRIADALGVECETFVQEWELEK
jgi:alkylhydroperoxidase family enzyme